MEKDFYSFLEKTILTSDIKEKEENIKSLFLFLEEKEIFFSKEVPKDFKEPSFKKICKIVTPKELPKRKRFDTKEGLGALLHSIAHIEFNAIDLALDAIYRFRDTPIEFKKDWLEVAKDEVRHFKMIEKILKELGYFYGDFPVHQGLFDAMINTKDSLVKRMAVIPRYYEATGLDVNPKIIQKLKSTPKKSDLIYQSIDALDIIYKEEISHVQKGDKWFKWACKKIQKEPQSFYFEILKEYGLLKRKAQINTKARLKAGFVCEELKRFGVKRC